MASAADMDTADAASMPAERADMPVERADMPVAA
jgi:hypothetical protein